MNQVARRVSTAAEQEMLHAPSIASQLPVVFENNVRFDRIDAKCVGCGEAIPAEHLRGTITRPFPSVAIMDAIGYCESCNLLSPVHYRLHSDSRLSGRAKDGRWAQWKMRPIKASILSRVFQWLTRL